MSGGEVILILESERKTIESIREITGKQHTDEDIYSLLKDCSMDPNDTAQKLFYLDTFHEVKKKRDKKKETLAPEYRGNRDRRRNFSSKYANSEAASGRNVAPRQENGVHVKEEGSSLQRASTVTSSGPSNLPNGNYSNARDVPLLKRDVKVTKDGSTVDVKKLDNASNEVKSPISSALIASDSTSVLSKPGALNETDRVQQNAARQNHIRGLNNVNGENPKNASATEEIVKIDLSEPVKPAPLNEGSLANGSSNYDDVVSPEGTEIQHIKLLSETTVPGGHVIFPDHFKVSEALKSSLTFGRFGADNSTKSSNETDETVTESSSSNENNSLIVQIDLPVQSEHPQHQPDKVLESVGSVASNADEKGDQRSAVIDQSKQELSFLAEANQNQTVQVVPNYSFGIIPTVQVVHPVQYEGHDTQSLDTRPSSLASVNSMASSSPSPTPTPPVQNNTAAPPQLVFSPMYAPNYLPYGYFNPYFLPPMHQFLSHNGLPQQLSTGSAYLSSEAAAAGIKYPLGQFKPEATGGNLTPIGFPPLYGSYGSFPVGFNPGLAVTSGPSSGNEGSLGSYGSSPVGFNPGLAVTSGPSLGNEGSTASQLKESQIYATGPLNEGSAWIPPPGQDSMPLNSLYHLASQHLTLASTQSGLGYFPGIYAPMAMSSTVNPFIQQSPGVSAATENAVPHLLHVSNSN